MRRLRNQVTIAAVSFILGLLVVVSCGHRPPDPGSARCRHRT
jgi:hypothetical protein